MPRSTILRLVVVVAVIAALVVGFSMISGKKASTAVPSADNNS